MANKYFKFAVRFAVQFEFAVKSAVQILIGSTPSGYIYVVYIDNKDPYWNCIQCDYVCTDKNIHPNECPKCEDDICRDCIVWHLDGRVVDREESSGDRRFLWKACNLLKDEEDVEEFSLR